MTDQHTSICSAALADSPLPQDGPDTAPSDSVKSTSGASESSNDTGQMSLFGMTCERSTRRMLPTPKQQDGKHGAATDYERLNRPNDLHVVASTSSPPATPASHSLSPGSDWARKMTATYGRKFADYWLSSDPPDSWVRTLLGTSVWGSMTCYLTWKKSATPQGRLLFRLVPSVPRTAGIGSGLLHTPTVTANQGSPSMVNRDPGSWRLWGTPTSQDHKDTGNMENVPVNGLLGQQVLMPTPRNEGCGAGMHRGKPDSLHSYAKLYPTALAQNPATGHRQACPRLAMTGQVTDDEARNAQSGKLNSAWVSRMMGYPDDWLTLDGEATR